MCSCVVGKSGGVEDFPVERERQVQGSSFTRVVVGVVELDATGQTADVSMPGRRETGRDVWWKSECSSAMQTIEVERATKRRAKVRFMAR